MKQVLAPLTGPGRPPRPHAVFDIETDPDDHSRALLVGFYDGVDYMELESCSALLDRICVNRYRSWTVYAHFGGRFDFVHLAAAADALGWDWSAILAGDTSRMIGLDIYRGARGSREGGGAHVFHFVDSYALLPAKLSALADALAPEHRKMEIDFRAASRAELAVYLKADCLALYHVVAAARDLFRQLGTEPKRTIAATAMSLFRTAHMAVGWPSCDWTREYTTPAKLGGRCEVFRRRADTVYGADVNSMYPFVMKTQDPPVHTPRRVGGARDPIMTGVYMVRAEISACAIPPLPLAADRLYFPIGNFRAIVWGPELIAALEAGHRVRIIEGIEYAPEPGAFSSYVDQLYGLKARGGALATIAKLALNSLYGKFGEDGWVYRIQRGGEPRPARPDYPGDMILNDEIGIFARAWYRSGPHMLHHVAGFITSCARAHLFRLLNAASRPAYCDTDSVWSDWRPDTGPELGGFKSIVVATGATFAAAKLYCYDAAGVHVTASKGAPGADPCRGAPGRISGLCTIRQYAGEGRLFHFTQRRSIDPTADRKRLGGWGSDPETRPPTAGLDCPAVVG